MSSENIYKTLFLPYAKSSFKMQNDLRFWQHFIKEAIKKYQEENVGRGWISQSGYSVYNSSPDGKDTWLYSNDFFDIVETESLEKYRESFFVWVMNMTVTRICGAMEKVLIQVIGAKYFPSLAKQYAGKSLTNAIISEIKNELKNNSIKPDGRNNRYLFNFISLKEKDFETYLSVPVNYMNWQTTWKDFIEMMFKLRNVIVHEDMVMTKDVYNSINSSAGDLFEYFYELELTEDGNESLKAKTDHGFLHLVSILDDFTANTIKFIAHENTIEFLGFTKA
jgi:hypothetical protein